MEKVRRRQQGAGEGAEPGGQRQGAGEGAEPGGQRQGAEKGAEPGGQRQGAEKGAEPGGQRQRKKRREEGTALKRGSGRLDVDLWLLLTLESWLLDFGRPIYALYVSQYFPLSLPSIGDYCHMAYNVLTAFILLRLFDRCSRPLPKTLQHLLVIVFVMGASIHLVGDSIQHRLIHSGYKLHLSVRDNPIIQAMQPASLVHTFELIYFYDEQLGHELWYIPLYISYTLYFSGCFLPAGRQRAGLGVAGWGLVALSAGFESYLVTEGQIFPLFSLTLVTMVILLLWRWREGAVMDSNAVFLLGRSVLTLVAVAMWVAWLWNDSQLREKYPGWLYVPEPWSYVSLYLMKL